MMRMRKRTMIWLSACLVAGSCATGDFCTVVSGPITFAPETARQIVATDRAAAERIDTQNTYGERRCDWH